MRLIVDASVAVKWLVQEEDSALANNLMDDRHEMLAPSFMALEAGNTLLKKVRRGAFNQSQALRLSQQIFASPVEWIDTAALTPEAIRLALELNHPVYDCIYLALARQTDALVVTADSRFVNITTGTPYEGVVMQLDRFAAT